MPPGLSTRASSFIALLVVRDVLEHLGRDDPVEGCRRRTACGVASPDTAVAAGRGRACPPAPSRRTSADAGAVQLGSRSKATTFAPRRYASNACRPAPQPRSSTRSPGRDAEPAGSRRSARVGPPSWRRDPGLGRGPFRSAARYVRATVAWATAGQANRSGPGAARRPASSARSAGRVVQPPQHRGEFLVLARRDQHRGVAGDLGQRARCGWPPAGCRRPCAPPRAARTPRTATAPRRSRRWPAARRAPRRTARR